MDLQKIKVFFDGWPLVYEPDSPAAIHLLTLLELDPPGIEARVGLPGEAFHPLPAGISGQVSAVPNTPAARLRWEQFSLPSMASASGAHLLHLTSGGPALRGSAPILVSPTAYAEAGLFAGWDGPKGTEISARRDARPGTLAARFRLALSLGGMARARALLWPDDLPAPDFNGRTLSLPPIAHPQFTENPTGQEDSRLAGLDLPESYVLYHGPTAGRDLRRLLDVWSWAADSIGGYYPLVLIGLDEALRGYLALLAEGYGLSETVHALPPVGLPELAALYRRSSAVFHPAPAPAWSGPLRQALACARPLVAWQSPRSAALVGPAAYLVPPSSGSRLLAAALITVIVEVDLASALETAARRRVAAWDPETFSLKLGEMYRLCLR
jgi:glycosyltransferase involved in cell wall biosynthesis